MSADRSLYRALREYAAGDTYPCHMPGHKRNPAGGEMADFFAVDITEIEGFDNLHHAEGIVKEAQERANRLYGADETFFLVNGSTGGILAAVMAAVRPGGEILFARNCHRSVYHAALLQNLKVHYYCPQVIGEYDICDGVSAADIGTILDGCPAIQAVIVTSPTYEGILSDVAGIAAAVHARDRILIVDEAHGAHLGIFEDTTGGAVAAGADLVIHSLHKTLPSLTQTALLHVNGNRVDRDRLRTYLAMVQSSSPSYVFMASIDACVRFLETEGNKRFVLFRAQRESFLKKTWQLRHIRVGKMENAAENGYAAADWDMGKILISVKNTGITGKQLADTLRESFHIELEMAAATYGLAMMTLMDTEEGWQRLADALLQIDDRIERERCGEGKILWKPNTAGGSWRQKAESADDGQRGLKNSKEWQAPAAELPEIVMTLAQAFHSEHEEVTLEAAAGRISADFICLYPPGIPLAAPGERLTKVILEWIAESGRQGLLVQGLSSAGRISVVVEIPEKIWHY